MNLYVLAGVALYYTEAIYGTPPVLTAHLQKFPALHDMNIFVTIRNVPVPQVLENERILLRPLGIRGFFHCIARWAPL
jgi:KUP system potassium uptake protein